MTRLLGLLLLSAFSVPALAADPPAVKAHHPRMTWEAHFAQANLAHDGHLTLAEAKGGDTSVAKHFDEIDATHRGYVTEDDVRVWRENHKTTRRRTKSVRAKHHGAGQETPVASTGAAAVAMPSGPPVAPGDTAGSATNKN
jgi:hypothetical protein